MSLLLKVISGMIAFVLVVLFVLRGFGIISWQIFWLAIILTAGFAYYLLPMLKKSKY